MLARECPERLASSVRLAREAIKFDRKSTMLAQWRAITHRAQFCTLHTKAQHMHKAVQNRTVATEQQTSRAADGRTFTHTLRRAQSYSRARSIGLAAFGFLAGPPPHFGTPKVGRKIPPTELKRHPNGQPANRVATSCRWHDTGPGGLCFFPPDTPLIGNLEPDFHRRPTTDWACWAATLALPKDPFGQTLAIPVERACSVIQFLPIRPTRAQNEKHHNSNNTITTKTPLRMTFCSGMDLCHRGASLPLSLVCVQPVQCVQLGLAGELRADVEYSDFGRTASAKYQLGFSAGFCSSALVHEVHNIILRQFTRLDSSQESQAARQRPLGEVFLV